MISGQTIAIFLIGQIATNAWWYCATQEEYLGASPAILFAVIPTIYLVIKLIMYIVDNWEI